MCHKALQCKDLAINGLIWVLINTLVFPLFNRFPVLGILCITKLYKGIFRYTMVIYYIQGLNAVEGMFCKYKRGFTGIGQGFLML